MKHAAANSARKTHGKSGLPTCRVILNDGILAIVPPWKFPERLTLEMSRCRLSDIIFFRQVCCQGRYIAKLISDHIFYGCRNLIKFHAGKRTLRVKQLPHKESVAAGKQHT
ncbi:hypothetical protein TNCV_405641 [Trichonephila clavipes]|nr:hypothetical protein TNCV_405641 [Trichonephila clavipes]